MVLEQIARKEQELRARLIDAHSRADELRAGAAREADDIRARGETAALAAARSWADQETEQARREAEDRVEGAIAESSEGRGEAHDAIMDEAVRFVAEAVLLSGAGPRPEPPARSH